MGFISGRVSIEMLEIWKVKISGDAEVFAK